MKKTLIGLYGILFLFILIKPAYSANYEIYILTMGTGDSIVTKWGHNAIRVKNLDTDLDIAFNYGTFSFGPNFISEFLKNEMRYWLAAAPYQLMVDHYKSRNRDIWSQKLNLTQEQTGRIVDFLLWNMRSENKYYKYHHFYDNCSTRIRDVLDRFLHKAVKNQTQDFTGKTLRDYVQNATKGNLILLAALDVLLNDQVDQPIKKYAELFSPLKLREYLNQIVIKQPDGSTQKLVSSEERIYQSNPPRTTSLMEYTNLSVIVLLLIFLGGIIYPILALKKGQFHKVKMALTFILFSLIFLTLSTVLIFMNIFSTHESTYGNEAHLAIFTTDLALLITGILLFFKLNCARFTLKWWSVTKLLAVSTALFLHLIGVFDQGKVYMFLIMGVFAGCTMLLSLRLKNVSPN